MTQHKFVFVCGLHRSGTSVLFRTLRQHPQISGFENTHSPENEGMHLQSIYKAPKYLGGAGYFGFNPEAYLTEKSSLFTKSNQEKIWQEWSRYWELDSPYLLEKSPSNILMSRFLQAMFPDSYFILIMRHPIAVTLATRQWYRRSTFRYYRIDRLIEHWIICHKHFWEDSAYLQNVKIIQYENFVLNTQGELNDIYEFLNLSLYTNTEPIKSNINADYFQKWRDLDENIFFRYMLKYIKAHYRDSVRDLGYELTPLP